MSNILLMIITAFTVVSVLFMIVSFFSKKTPPVFIPILQGVLFGAIFTVRMISFLGIEKYAVMFKSYLPTMLNNIITKINELAIADDETNFAYCFILLIVNAILLRCIVGYKSITFRTVICISAVVFGVISSQSSNVEIYKILEGITVIGYFACLIINYINNQIYKCKKQKREIVQKKAEKENGNIPVDNIN